MFKPVAGSANFPELELSVLKFWKEREIYAKTLKQRKEAERFVFFEGPPTANGMPHPGHCLTRAIKDVFPRYKTMRGYLCERKAGWDTHGLPVEVEVCKELGIHSKEEIENYGVEPFIHKCQASVWRYMQEWERLTERLGFWVNLKEAYVTYHQSYVESVWWCLKNLFDRGLLYQGHKIVWWWAQGGTALSSGEVGLGYREVADPSVYIRFPLIDEQTGAASDVSLLVWTTTPWTLPSNQFAAVHADLEYSQVRDAETGDKFIIASALVETIAGKVKRELVVEKTLKGSELVGRRYLPPFDYYHGMPMEDASAGNKETPWGQLQAKLKSGGSQVEAWRIVAADFVTIDSGTGAVHIAPAFGEVDYDLLAKEQQRFAEGQGPSLICAVDSSGKFTEDAREYEGRWVKDCDKDISRELKHRGLLYHHEQYLHDYPFCWRAESDPLIQYPRKSWFIRTTQFKDAMVANNKKINWLPEHIRDGRFGNFLESNVDWALSRERYWGTPLPIWYCEETGTMEAIGSYGELLAKPGVQGTEVWLEAKKKNPELVDDLAVHKPYIDAVTYDSPYAKGARMRRVSEVIDCWFDSGAMPFAQWGYRGENGPAEAKKHFAEQFPADFISEAIDQTRGWFYSLLSISTMLFSEEKSLASETSNLKSEIRNLKSDLITKPYPHPYKNCIVLGLMLGEDGQKMSKSKRNYREPREIFDKYGADALRWYLYANQPPWTSIRYNERSIKESIPEFILRLWNVYSFFVIYANIDEFDPASLLVGDVETLDFAAYHRAASNTNVKSTIGFRPVRERSELNRWLLSELNRTAAGVVERMDAYDNYGACKLLSDFVEGLSNWYVRRGRANYWAGDKTSPIKMDAYWTLYETLVTLSKLIAPFTPFVAETLWQNLAGSFGERAVESVHLCEYPTGDPSLVDEQLSTRMHLVREISSLGRAARMEAKLKVRQPLLKVEVVLADPSQQSWLESHAALICDELNVKTLEFTSQPEQYITYQVQPNFKRLGPKIGKLLPALKAALAKADGAKLLAEMKASGKVTLQLDGGQVELDGEDIQVRLDAKPGWAAAQGTACVVVLSTELTPELLREGMAKDLVRLIQDRRRELNLDYTDRIRVGIVSSSAELGIAVKENAAFIQEETLALSLSGEPIAGVEAVTVEDSDQPVSVFVVKA